MYPLYSPEQSSLAADDIEGICFLYPAGDCGASCPADMLCSSEGCVARCGETVCDHDQICVDDVCSTPAPTLPCSTGSDPSCTQKCQTNADCPAASICAAGRCLHQSAAGDPCEQASDCASAACNDDGVCVSPCTNDRDCGAGSSCEKQATGNQTCEATTLPFGATCHSADDCTSQECLADLTAEPTCTRLCGEDYPAAPGCPAGWACSRIDKRHVCTPPRRSAGGCATAPNSDSIRPAPFMALLALMIFAFGRRTLRHGLRERL
jgi:hypothetical protein